MFALPTSSVPYTLYHHSTTLSNTLPSTVPSGMRNHFDHYYRHVPVCPEDDDLPTLPQMPGLSGL
jgi:hypothetical protein